MSGFACWCVFVTWVFFIKRKTAYELRISDWSSDGCSSDLGCESDLTLAALGIRDRTWTQEHRDAPLADEIPRRVGNPCGQAVWTGRTRVRQHRARARAHAGAASAGRSEEHTSELQSLMRISYAVFCLTKKQKNNKRT